MKKIAIVLFLSAFLGFAFSPVVFSNNNEKITVCTDTTKTVKKSCKTKGCSKHCQHSCTSKTKAKSSCCDSIKKK